MVFRRPFQVPHAGLPDLCPDGRGKKHHRCGNEVFLEDPAQVAKSLSDGQGIGIPTLKSCGSHSPRLDVGVAGASGNGKNHPTAKSAEVFVLSAVVPWALSNTEALQGVDQKAGGIRLSLHHGKLPVETLNCRQGWVQNGDLLDVFRNDVRILLCKN
jgi:hypothetical protein